jgi:hypothetical protein
MIEACLVFSFLSFVSTAVIAALLYERLPWLMRNPAVREPDETEPPDMTSIGRKEVRPWGTR